MINVNMKRNIYHGNFFSYKDSELCLMTFLYARLRYRLTYAADSNSQCNITCLSAMLQKLISLQAYSPLQNVRSINVGVQKPGHMGNQIFLRCQLTFSAILLKLLFRYMAKCASVRIHPPPPQKKRGSSVEWWVLSMEIVSCDSSDA
jgi:hypothetical protein